MGVSETFRVMMDLDENAKYNWLILCYDNEKRLIEIFWFPNIEYRIVSDYRKTIEVTCNHYDVLMIYEHECTRDIIDNAKILLGALNLEKAIRCNVVTDVKEVWE